MGTNCTACSSLRAAADTSSPSETAPITITASTRKIVARLPRYCTFRTKTVKAMITTAWMSANTLKPARYPATSSPRRSGVAMRRSSVPLVRSRRNDTAESRKMKKNAKNAMSTGAR